MSKNIYIVIDESGAMHDINNNYFIIGGFITDNLELISSFAGNFESNHLKRKNKNHEFKCINIKNNLSEKYIEFVSKESCKKNIFFQPIAIIINKKEVKSKGLISIEKRAYSFFLKKLINQIKWLGIIPNNKNINLYCDYRNDVDKFKLKKYLEKNERFIIKLNSVNFKNSKSFISIRLSDMIVGRFFRLYNRNIKIKILEDLEEKYRIKFPHK